MQVSETPTATTPTAALIVVIKFVRADMQGSSKETHELSMMVAWPARRVPVQCGACQCSEIARVFVFNLVVVGPAIGWVIA